MTLNDWLTIFAILTGPVLGVALTRLFSSWADARARKLHVFRTLMGSRRRRLDPEHVSALNLVEVEFYDVPRVRKALRDLTEVFDRPRPAPNSPDFEAYLQKFREDHDEKLTRLLDEMARHLGYGFQQLEILKGGYHPEAHATAEEHIWKTRALLSDIYDGKRYLPIGVIDFRTVEQIIATQQAYEQKLGSSEAGRGDAQ